MNTLSIANKGLIVSAIVLCISLPLGVSWTAIYNSVIQLQLELSSDSFMFSALGKESPVGVYMEIYLWNLKNGHEFERDKTIKPDMEEVGPFVFKITSSLTNVSWNDNFTVTFSPNKTYQYVPEMSVPLDTPITTIHPVPAVMAYYTRLWNSELFQQIMDAEVRIRETFLLTSTAEKWLFTGIEDSLFSVMVPLKKVLNINIPDKFAWFASKNDSASEGRFTVFTGADDLDKVGILSLWNGKNQSFAYDGECGVVGGSAGQAFHRMQERPDFVSVFAADACSQVYLEAAGDVEVEGVPGWLFVGSNKTLDNGEIDERNKCFCPGECMPTGARNVSACKFNAPAFLTFPHFYLSDETYQKSINGLKPNASHGSSLTIEPTLGIPLSVSMQLQVNLMLQPSDRIKMYKDVPQILIPIIWFRQKAAVTPKLATMVNILLLLPTIGYIVFYTLAGLSFISFVVCLYYVFKLNKSFNSSDNFNSGNVN